MIGNCEEIFADARSRTGLTMPGSRVVLTVLLEDASERTRTDVRAPESDRTVLVGISRT